MTRSSRQVAPALVAVAALAAASLTVLASPAAAGASSVVIAEVHGGGGNTGATFRQDFIELHNVGSTAVDVSTWSVQYASATGTTWQATNLTGTIPAGARYLIQQAPGANTAATNLPTPDVTGTIAMGGSAGKVALVMSRTACTGTECASTDRLDLVGYGAANGFEGTAPAPGTTSNDSVSRTAGDTNDNRADFVLTNPPTPQGTGAPATAPRTPGAASCTAPATDLTAISAVQGSGATSPLVSATQTVQLEGIVVGNLSKVEAGGFFLQSPSPDNDPATSEGVFVSSPAIGTVTLGDRVRAAGLVKENFGLTTLVADDVKVCAIGQMLPPATELAIPSDDPARERLEGMRVTPTASNLTVTELYNLDGYGELVLAAGGAQVQPNELYRPGSATATATMTMNRLGRITLDDGRSAPNLRPLPYLSQTVPVRIGDRVQRLEDVVLSFGFGNWRLQPADGDARNIASSTFEATNPRPATPTAVGGTYKVGAFNVLNYFTTLTTANSRARGASNLSDFGKQQAKIVAAINRLGVDVVALQEIENSAALGEQTDEALAALTAALNEAAGAGTWAFVPSSTDLPPASDQDVITNAIVYKPSRVTKVGRSRSLIDEENFDNAREPVAQTFSANGDLFTVIGNHFKSKGGTGTGANADLGQGNFTADRIGQARAVLDFAEQLRSETGDSDVLILGDLNSYTQEDPVEVLRQGGFRDLVETLKPNDHSYVFDGLGGSLDHALASVALSQKVTGVDVWNINSPESDGYQYNGVSELYAADPFRASDHDPVVIGLNLGLQTTTPYEVQVLGINDFHGRLEPPVTARNGSPSKGGAAFLAAAVNQARAQTRNTVLASAGDNIGASPFVSAVQQDAPALAALDLMGLETTSVGNHEFDRGYADLAGRVARLAGFPFLGANVLGETPELPSTHTVTLVDGVRVGFIGVTTEQTGSLVSPAGIRGITFADIVGTVNKAADALTDGNANNGEADVLVLLAHEGPFPGATTPSECAALAARADEFGRISREVTPKVDAIIAGHTHQLINCQIPQQTTGGVTSKGSVRPILEAGEYGQFLGRFRFTWNPATRTITNIRTDQTPIDSATFSADPVMQRLVDQAVASAKVVGQVPVGRLTADLLRGRTGAVINRGVEGPLGNFVADVQLAATQGAELGGAQIAFMNPGGLRTDLLFASSVGGEGDGVVTYAEAADLQPFANGIITMTLSGAQVKQVLEEQYRLNGAATDYLALGVSRGFRFEFDDAAPAGSRTRNLTLNGTPLNPTTDYRVSVNSFLSNGGDSFRTLTLGRNRQDNGFNDLNVLVETLRTSLAPGQPMTPDLLRRTTPTSFANSGSPAAPVDCRNEPSLTLEESEIIATGSTDVVVRALPGTVVELFAYTRPSTRFRVVRTARVGSGGVVSFSILPSGNTRLYAQLRGCRTDAVTDSVVLNVRTALTLVATREGPGDYTFSGDSIPARAGGQIVSLYRVTPQGRQILTAQTRTRASDGEWEISRRFTGTGGFGFVVRTTPDLQNAAGASNIRPTRIF